MKDKCVICGADSPYDSSTPIEFREGYIEGGGQLCVRCDVSSRFEQPLPSPIKSENMTLLKNLLNWAIWMFVIPFTCMGIFSLLFGFSYYQAVHEEAFIIMYCLYFLIFTCVFIGMVNECKETKKIVTFF